MNKFNLTEEFVAEVRETGAGVHNDNLWCLIDELAAEVQRLRRQSNEDSTADEHVLEEAGHLSFTAMLAEFKHLREENKRLREQARCGHSPWPCQCDYRGKEFRP